MDKTESEWILAAEGRIRGVIATGPLRTFSSNTNCPGRSAWRSGFSYGRYRLDALGSVVAENLQISFGFLAKNLQFVEGQLNLKKGSVSVLRNGVVVHFRPLSVFEFSWYWLSYCWGHAVRPRLARVIRLQSLAEVHSFFLAFPDSYQVLGQVYRPKNLHSYKFTFSG